MLGDKDHIKKVVEAVKWKFSCIDGDITLGEGVKCYATMHYSIRHKETEIIEWVADISRIFRYMQHINVLREKVELVLYDKKIGKLVTP